MNGKSLLLALVLIAAVAGLWLCFPGKGGLSGGEGVGSGEWDGDAVEKANGVAVVSGSEEVEGERSRNFRKTERGAGERLANAESEVVKARLREMQRRDDEGLMVETMPDGHQSIHLQGRFQHVTRLVETGDGRMVPVCGNYVPSAEIEVADE
ncbi:MAG: hypothetical protein ACSHX9_13625 [Luteolibacter sp.]